MHTPTARPRISVLLPTYNYAAYLPLAIESVLAQRDADFELIISDDASTDDSVAIARRYAARDPRVRVEAHVQNLGMVANWNWCLREARGEYVKFLFGDDALVAPDALATLAAALDENPGASLAGSARALLDDTSRRTGLWDDLAPGLHHGARLFAQCLRRRRNLIGEPSSTMFRREDAVRGFDPSFRQIVDLEMWFHLLLGGDFVYIARPLCAFRLHELQQTRVNNRARVTDGEMVRLLERYLPQPRFAAHLPVGSPVRDLIVYRQIYYLLKDRAPSTETGALVAYWRQQLRGWAYVRCRFYHRIGRPWENLRRKLTTWGRSLRVATGFAEPDQATAFLSRLSSYPAFRREGGDWAEGFAHPLSRRLATSLLAVGVFSVLWGFNDYRFLFGPRPPFPIHGGMPHAFRPPGGWPPPPPSGLAPCDVPPPEMIVLPPWQ